MRHEQITTIARSDDQQRLLLGKTAQPTGADWTP